MQLKKEGRFKAPEWYLLIDSSRVGSISLGTMVGKFQQPLVVL